MVNFLEKPSKKRYIDNTILPLFSTFTYKEHRFNMVSIHKNMKKGSQYLVWTKWVSVYNFDQSNQSLWKPIAKKFNQWCRIVEYLISWQKPIGVSCPCLEMSCLTLINNNFGAAPILLYRYSITSGADKDFLSNIVILENSF